MKRLDIEYNLDGLMLSLFDGEYYRGEVRFDSGGYFETIWGEVQYPEARLAGQTELEKALNYLAETSKRLLARKGELVNETVYIGFENNEGLTIF